jgi:GDP/UDP-N,N'-diacetylbacillosamine 2-epimerase (hydrolysing)
LKNEFSDQVLCIENFGKENYFTAMHFARLIMGNTSSGILEAASFGKYVVNVGDRQKGRLQSKNILNAKFDKYEIIDVVNKALKFGKFIGENVYYKQNVANTIIKIIKRK